MSSRIWEDSSIINRTELLVLLAIADNANDDGICWPSIETIARKARTTLRTVFDTLKSLETTKRLEVTRGKGPKGTNVYRLLFGGVKQLHMIPTALDSPEPARKSRLEIAPDPSGTVFNSQKPPRTEGTPADAGGAHKEFIKQWTDRYKERFEYDYVFKGGRDGKAVKDLLAAGLTPETLMGIAEAAWDHKGDDDYFNCQKASTLYGFADRINEIRAEVTPQKRIEVEVPDIVPVFHFPERPSPDHIRRGDFWRHRRTMGPNI